MLGPGLDGLSFAERRRVRAAITQGRRLDDPRLAEALVGHAEAYLADRWTFELRTALLTALSVAAALGVVTLLWPDGTTPPPLSIGLALGALQLLVGENLRRKQYRGALRRHAATPP